MSLEANSLVNSVRLEKILLSRKVGQFLCASQENEERMTVEHIARMLARDENIEVRGVLSYGLRICDTLPSDLATRIATDDHEVSAPFMEVTRLFDDGQMSELVPQLKEKSRVRVAGRSDIGVKTAEMMAKVGGAPSVSKLLENSNAKLTDSACQLVIGRFEANRRMMDQMSQRAELSHDIAAQIAWKVSDKNRARLAKDYDINLELLQKAEGMAGGFDTVSGDQFDPIFKRIDGASSAQIHAFASDLRSKKQLTHDLTLNLAERGATMFLESALALTAGLPVGQVREMLSLQSKKSFMKLMEMAGAGKKYGPRYLAAAKKSYAMSADTAAA